MNKLLAISYWLLAKSGERKAKGEERKARSGEGGLINRGVGELI